MAQTSAGRYLVNEVRIIINGRKLLQAELDQGTAAGLKLREIVAPASGSGHLLVVWDRQSG